MDLRFINSVLYSVSRVLAMSTMEQVSLKHGAPKRRQPFEISPGVVSGVLFMSGPEANASVALSFSKEAAEGIAKIMLPDGIMSSMEHSVADLVGELTNMVIGDAKRQLEEKGVKLELSLPTLIRGESHLIAHRADAPVIIVPYESDVGPFWVEAAYQPLAQD